MMGLESARRADLLIVTDDNPRSEVPSEIRAKVLAGARDAASADQEKRSCEVREIGDRRAAIHAAVAAARTGDAVVIAGKGHELGQEIAGVVHPFSDRAELLAALTEFDRAARPTTVHPVTAPSDAPRTGP
jgi:UDP-N-acetylmuramoyl-L-alanyl-D-glutamate--2,6-diaminopimelate ligase